MREALVYLAYLLEKHPKAMIKLAQKALELINKSECERLAEELEPPKRWVV